MRIELENDKIIEISDNLVASAMNDAYENDMCIIIGVDREGRTVTRLEEDPESSALYDSVCVTSSGVIDPKTGKIIA